VPVALDSVAEISDTSTSKGGCVRFESCVGPVTPYGVARFRERCDHPRDRPAPTTHPRIGTESCRPRVRARASVQDGQTASVTCASDAGENTQREANGTAVDAGDGQAATRVVIAEDDVLLREGLASLLERSGFEVVGQTGDSRDLLGLVRNQSPELVLTDIRMPPTNTTEGLEGARMIRAQFPDTAILVLSAHVEVEHAMELLASGKSIGYLLKSRISDVADFIDTVQRISHGASVVDPALVQELFSARRHDDPLAALSEREREVLALMAEGRSNAGIARSLWVTEGTIEKHVRSIMSKLNLPGSGDDHRRVLAVIAFLDAR
jgi:DNA-binding NarL/FixJ family response regulator